MHDTKRLQVVDGLRAIAIASVVLFHGFPWLAPGGFIGVDIFFVISGFVIALRYLDPLISGETTFPSFFLRRIRRLVPAYLLVLIVTTIASIWILSPEDLLNFGKSLFAQALYVQNIAFWNIGDYFDAALAKPLLHTWSLAVEEQFYLVFPFAILLLRWRRRPALLLLGLAAVGSFVAGNLIGHISPKTSFYWIPFRVWEFLAGIFAATLFQRGAGERMSRQLGTVVVGASTVALLVTIFAFNEDEIFPGLQAAIAVLATAAICLFQLSAASWLRNLFANRLAQEWGRISYSWYLWHWPPLSFYFALQGHRAGWAAATVITIAGYLMGAVSYRTIERWGLRSPGLKRPRRSLGLLVAFLGFAGCVGAALVVDRGLIERYPVREQALLRARMDVPSYRCPLVRRLAAWNEQICRLNDVKGRGGILLIGDSHANQVKDAIAGLGERAGVPVYLVKQNCRAVDYGLERSCPLRQWSELEADIARHGITKLVLISRWPIRFDPQRFLDAFARLSRMPVHVYLEQSGPEDRLLNPRTYLDRHADWAGPSGYSLQQHWQQRGEQAQFLRDYAAHHPQITVLDPVPLLCGSGVCDFSRGGVPLYRDSHHFTSAGVRSILPMYDALFAAIGNSDAGSPLGPTAAPGR